MVDPDNGLPLLKIGATRKHPLQRARELSAGTGVPDSFEIAYYHDFADAFVAETMAHERFESNRVNTGREFFCVDVKEVVDYLAGLCNSSTYRGAALESEGIEGGECAATHTAAVKLPATPWAELFATFDPDGPPELDAAERAQCRALERSLSR